MIGCVPERKDKILSLWNKYDPEVILVDDAKRVTLNATKDRIKLDAKTMDVFWLIGFGGWRAIECYMPHVIYSAASGKTVSELMQNDEELADVERDYKERRAAAQTLINSANSASAPWPPDLPRPSADRNALTDPQYQATFDLTCMAVAFAVFHEFRHVMLDRNNERPQDLREEELSCDVWARSFMTANIAAYADDHNHNYSDVLRKRSMAFALAALILHEITPVWDHGGNSAYYSIAVRLQTILDNTPLPDNDRFWIFAASLLIGIFRQKGFPTDAPAMSSKALVNYLIARL